MACLESILSFELPPECALEVLVLDGRSTDRTRQIVQEVASRDPRVQLVDNPGMIQTSALNIGVRMSAGQWIMRLDAHAKYPPDYLLQCFETAQRTGAENVGGVLITKPGGDTYGARIVQALTTHKFGVGNAGFRTDGTEGEADTVPFGFFRREVFDRLGWFDERLVRAQDYEFNRRIKATGGKVWRNQRINVYYFNQPGLLPFYKKQFVQEAPYNAYLWYVAPYAFCLRHGITVAFAIGVVAGLALSPLSDWLRWGFLSVMTLYASMAVMAALQQAVRYSAPMHAVALPFCFFFYHFIHGLGVLMGGLRLLLRIAPVQKHKAAVPLAKHCARKEETLL